MNRIIEGMQYHIAVWPLGLALLLCAVAAWLRSREPQSAPEPPQHYTPPMWLGVRLLGTLLLLVSVLPLLLFFLLSWHGDPPISSTQAFHWLMPIDVAISVVGAVLAMLAPRRTADSTENSRQAWQRAAAGLFGALCALGHVWSIFDAGTFPKIERNGCSMVQAGLDCPFQLGPEGARWHVTSQPVLHFDKPGTYTPVVRLRNGTIEIEQPISVSVGDDRGSPFFAPRVGDEWRFEYVNHGSTRVFLVGSSNSGSWRIGTLTLRATGELMSHGRRWVRLETEAIREKSEDPNKPDSQKAEPKTEIEKGVVWIFFHNGQTYFMPGSQKEPTWWQTDEIELAVFRPDVDPTPQRADGRKYRGPSIPYPASPITEHSVGCEFRILGLGCRCAERGLGLGHMLPGPAFCEVESEHLSSLAIMFLTAFMALPDYKTDLILTESRSQTGLPPPQPPLVDLPSQEEFIRRALEDHERREEAKREAKKAKDADAFAAYSAPIIAMFDKGYPALAQCRGTKNRTGQAQLSLCISTDGRAYVVRLDDEQPRVPDYEFCVQTALKKREQFPVPPSGIPCLKFQLKY